MNEIELPVTGTVPTTTVAELAAALLALPDQGAYVIAANPVNGWYLNVRAITPSDDNENIAAVIETFDDYDTRQW